MGLIKLLCPPPPSAPTAEFVYTESSSSNVEQTEKAASSIPNFGSVTQSSNYNVSGITTDAATTSFDGSNLSVTIRRQDSSALTINTARDYKLLQPFTSSNVDPDSGKTDFKFYWLLGHTSRSATGSQIFVFWDRADPADYLAGGYWLHVTGDVYNDQISGVEVGVFVDGPELTGTPSLPNSGTASYRGESGGIYAVSSGSSDDYPQGSFRLGDFVAPLTLSVDFGSDTISGCLGCTGSIQVTNIRGVMPNGQPFASFGPFYAPYRVRMTAGSINSDGTFTGRITAFEGTSLATQSVSGNWGGKFSTIPATSGGPRLVAGTNGADIRFVDGTDLSFLGAFYGVKQ